MTVTVCVGGGVMYYSNEGAWPRQLPASWHCNQSLHQVGPIDLLVTPDWTLLCLVRMVWCRHLATVDALCYGIVKMRHFSCRTAVATTGPEVKAVCLLTPSSYTCNPVHCYTEQLHRASTANKMRAPALLRDVCCVHCCNFQQVWLAALDGLVQPAAEL
jgi:hypothetical protein